jgi:hypothetical protein
MEVQIIVDYLYLKEEDKELEAQTQDDFLSCSLILTSKKVGLFGKILFLIA